MTTRANPDVPPTQPTFEPADPVSIADLSPVPANSSSHILANVALVWPYSSSTGTLALLLADPDIRARKARGQVKVVFRDGSAREVARTKVGIGDTIRLALVGCEWEETGETVSTPGKKIDWDLEFKSRVIIQVSRDDAVIASLNYTAPEDDIPTTNGPLEILSTLRDIRPQLNGTLDHEPSTIHVPFVTPSKSATKFHGTTFFDASLDPFTEDDGYGQGRGRKRTKFARHSGAWNLVNSEDEETPVRTPQQPATTVALVQTPSREQDNLASSPLGDASVDGNSPREQRRIQEEGHATSQEYAQEHRAKEDLLHQVEANSFVRQQTTAGTKHRNQLQGNVDSGYIAEQPSAQEEQLAHNIVGETANNDQPAQPTEQLLSQSVVMGPPQTPMRISHLPTPEEFAVGSSSGAASDATSTPRLHPLASPGLPLVSPLVRRHGVATGYFPPFQEGLSQLDATRVVAADEEANQQGEALVGIQDAPIGHSRTYDMNQEASKFHDELDTSLDAVEEPFNQRPALASASPHPPIEPHLQSPSTNQDFEAPTAASHNLNEALQNKHPEITATEQWLSSAELTIAHELLKPDNESQNLRARHQAAEIIEIEDDDLYGAPPDIAKKAAPPSRELTSPSQQKSPSDVVEQFFQMSPVAAATGQGPETLEGSASRRAPEEMTEVDLGISTVNYRSPSIYDGDSFPPEQQWERPKSSHYINRGSPTSHTPAVSSLDGNVDESEGSALAQGRIADVSEALTWMLDHSPGMNQPAGADIDMADESRDPSLQQTSKATAHEVVEIIMEKADETGIQEAEDVAIGGELPSVPQKPDVVTHPATIGVVELDHSLVEMPQVIIEESQEILGSLREERFGKDEASGDQEAEEITIIEERQVFISQEGDVPDNSLAPTSGLEAGGQLLSPDQTQLDHPFVDRNGEMMSPQWHPSIAHGLPTPVQTQEEPIASSIEETTRSQPDEVAAPVIRPQPQAETPAPRRISQRLSVRRPIMPSDISSPYFTPRRPSREPSSSPMRKEYLKPFVPSVSSPSSPPVHGREASAEAQEPFAQINGEKKMIIQNHQEVQAFAPRAMGTTTPLAYYPYLTSLHEHFSQLVDIIAVCIQDCPQPERAKSGPKDYHTTLRLVDSSCQSDAVTVQIFRPVKTALPTPRRGDALLLRNFKVQTLNRKFMLLSTESSSWAIFQASHDGKSRWTDVLTPGPPVEYGPHEEQYASSLLSWWEEDGNNRFESSNQDMTKTNMSNGVKVSRQSPNKPLPASRRRGNRADNFGNEGDVTEDAEGEVHESIPSTDTTDHDPNGSTTSIAPSSPTAAMTEPTPRRSVRLRQSASPAKELKNGSQDAPDHGGDDHEANGTSGNWSKESNRRRQSTISIVPSSPDMAMKEATPQRTSRPRRSATPMQDVSFSGNDEAGTSPENLRNGRRGSTVSIASSTPKPGTKEAGRRRSGRHRKSPSLVHELRDGTKYVDDGQPRRASVVHELRDGATYVDE